MEEKRNLEAVPPQISCEVCQHEVPLSEAVVPEAADSMVHFCSLDCYAAWRARAAGSYASLR
jgi:hypothetical protein